MRTTRLRLIIGIIFFTVFILMHLFGVFKYITIENLRKCGDQCTLLVHHYYSLSALSYCLVYIAVIVFALPAATVMTLIGGYLFGMPLGALYAMVAATLGAVCSFLLVRYCLGDFIQEKYAEKLQKVNSEIAKYGANYLLVMRLVHIFPFFLVNILAALTIIPLSTFTVITLIGLIPSALIFGFVGQQLHTIETITDVFSLPIILAFLALSLLAALPLIMRYVKKKH